jgi:peptidoglycan/LPS O-acetylase OafA/YrhL
MPSQAYPMVRQIMTVWLRGGWIGVDLFFVLSGYLISGLLFREYRSRRTVDVKRFLIRRGLKIYPAFLVLVAVTCAFRISMHSFSVREALAQVFFVQNYVHVDGQWLHTWSLAVEEHFYLAVALAAWALNRRGGPNPFRIVPRAFACLAVGCLAARIITSMLRPEFDVYTNIFPTHLRADSLMFGVLLCYLDQFHHQRFRSILRQHRVLIAIASLGLIAPEVCLDAQRFFVKTIGLTTLYIGFGGLLMLSLESRTAARSKLIIWIGKIGFSSYSIYLWHITWRHFILGLRFPSFWEVWPCYICGSIAFGILMSRLIEIPVLYFRDRFFPSDAPAITSDASPESTQKSSTRSSEIPVQTV